ncbi:MAG: hypothetical protein M0Z48_06010 [Nitrospiraceae bacterium]|nr:hypothetical protein [Nitrospiraceae bacterium]
MGMRFLRTFMLAIAVIAVSGCAGTRLTDDALMHYQVSADRATIIVKRPCVLGLGRTFYVQDDKSEIGKIGTCGKLTWGHEPGYIAVLAINDHKQASQVIIFPVEVGKTYKLVYEVKGAYVYFEPGNFPQELIAFEDESKPEFWGGLSPLPNKWQIELKKLQKGQH